MQIRVKKSCHPWQSQKSSPSFCFVFEKNETIWLLQTSFLYQQSHDDQGTRSPSKIMKSRVIELCLFIIIKFLLSKKKKKIKRHQPIGLAILFKIIACLVIKAPF